MMKYLVIPDVHNHTSEVERQIVRYPTDRVIFLGDYFDSFGDTPIMAAETAEWLKDSLQKPGRLHLFGNHDLWYRFPRNPQICWVGSGFTPAKSREISAILTAEDWEKLKLVEFVGDIALCHAGINETVFSHPVSGVTRSRVEELCGEALADAAANIDHRVFSEEGIVWLRWWNFEPLSAFSQFVGHTPSRDLRIECRGGRCNVCLDTMGRYLGLIEDGRMAVIDDEAGRVVWRQGDATS
ncbi:MAG: metallophosphoesterase [Verrucomicrobiae bacterium]|nr:metallophosphoesterase [Verrucomicrobiae bacterium]MCB1089025.1 metallophosphoesterase [Verrucomicrobiae bacterium]MCB1091882.1 metallophosphoesterase [Verrucomicrobiae bacterium]